jgi:hypothetical protein
MICSICHEDLNVKHGNNAAPINDGQCCDRCNSEVVIPARIAAAKEPTEAEEHRRFGERITETDPTGLIIHKTDGSVWVVGKDGRLKPCPSRS